MVCPHKLNKKTINNHKGSPTGMQVIIKRVSRWVPSSSPAGRSPPAGRGGCETSRPPFSDSDPVRERSRGLRWWRSSPRPSSKSLSAERSGHKNVNSIRDENSSKSKL